MLGVASGTYFKQLRQSKKRKGIIIMSMSNVLARLESIQSRPGTQDHPPSTVVRLTVLSGEFRFSGASGQERVPEKTYPVLEVEINGIPDEEGNYIVTLSFLDSQENPGAKFPDSATPSKTEALIKVLKSLDITVIL